MYNIDIDTGGTMTDGLVSGEDTVLALKVETTPHDVTIAFVDILEAARDALGFSDLRALLTQVEVITFTCPRGTSNVGLTTLGEGSLSSHREIVTRGSLRGRMALGEG